MMYSYLLRKSKALTKWLWKHLYLSAKKEPAKVFTLLFLFQTRFLEVKLIIVLTKTLSSRSTQLQGLHHSALIFFWKYHRTLWREWLKREYMLSFFFFWKAREKFGLAVLSRCTGIQNTHILHKKYWSMPSRLSKDASVICSTSLEVLSKKTELLKHYLPINTFWKYILHFWYIVS